MVTSCLVATAVFAAAYRYKDEHGQWVYTDRPPANGSAEGVTLRGSGDASPRMVVIPRSSDTGVELVAVNACRCAVEFAVKAETSRGVLSGRKVVPAGSEQTLLEVPATDGPSEVRYEYGFVVGEPNVEHRPTVPYRAPFALAQQFMVTQAPPDAVTHVDAASRNAIDIAMPVGTAVHAAREGLVINVARSHFRGGLQLAALSEANFVQILHDDGTYAIYAHLQLDTVRVRPGQRVARGEYIANSGNTGFTSGPHLHFVVLRNVGLRSESVPVSFAGSGGNAVAAHSGHTLAAY
jgi:murein DD-endopeptidase MepM/ murein hydrolase activator NlpD